MRILFLIIAMTVTGESITDFKARGFRYQGAGFRLKGEEAHKKGGKIIVKNAQLTVEHDGDLMLVSTPNLEFDLNTKRGFGKGEVKMRSRSVIISGVGFRVDAGRKHFVIQSKVRIIPLGCL